MKIKLSLFLMIFAFLLSCQPEWIKRAPKYDYENLDHRQKKVHQKAEEFLYFSILEQDPFPLHRATRIDSLSIDDTQHLITIDFNRHFSDVPMREQNVLQTYRRMKDLLGKKYKNYKLILRSLELPIQDLIPNYYRSSSRSYDVNRLASAIDRPLPLVRKQKPWKALNGLDGKNIALWNSHGWYYKNGRNRWEWQRPRLFQTVEDLLPTGFVLPYLIPMLEHAGAMVFDPRERDIQSQMVVVDNDGATQNGMAYQEISGFWKNGTDKGFATGQPPYTNENPFELGSSRMIKAENVETGSVIWIPEIPESGDYSVYVSYVASDSNVNDAVYTVYHSGGQSKFLVNQQISGKTWVYLGTFLFKKGLSADSGAVYLSNQSEDSTAWVSADAVRFGGGMGNIRRNGRTSGRPRYIEAARYNLQFSGIPDSLVWNFNDGRNDYKDDYQSRGEWVNYLKGAPYGPNLNRDEKGLGIPIDLSLAFHTDAGITHSDTTIGTLAIYSLVGADTQKVFPDSMSRLASRDFADVLQSQVVEDIRLKYNLNWPRRALMNALYSETFRPNAPAAILELLSHQNFRDMQFALDPQFRFHTARAIYKAILRFLSATYLYDYIVQPLPVTHFSATFDSLGRVRLKWKAQEDVLETSAMPDKYMVYKCIENNGFDDGYLVVADSLIISDLKPGIVYRFKVSAINDGGESFPSEILSVCRMTNNKSPIMIVNGFDRVSAPARFEQQDLSGFFNLEDEGVPDRYDLSYTGSQNDFSSASPFRVNDAPGHGASDANYETQIIAGNTFDYPVVHGRAIRAAGYSFVSSSDESIMDGQIRLNDYKLVDLILGEERSMPWLDSTAADQFAAFPEELQKALSAFTEAGGNLFVSGAHVATDLFAGKEEKHPDVRFGRDVLKISWVTNHAARTGWVFSVDHSIIDLPEIEFNSEFDRWLYKVEAPDALGPADVGQTILRYKENEFSAGAAYAGKDYRTLVLGFPFESIIDQTQKNHLMESILKFLDVN